MKFFTAIFHPPKGISQAGTFNRPFGYFCDESGSYDIFIHFYIRDSDCVHTMPAHFENGEKYDGCKI